MTEAEIGGMHFENGGRGHKRRNRGSREKLKKAQKWILHSESPERTSPTDTLTLAQ